ncbi:MAG: HD-GYP domain-containing protein [Nitrospirae bacterium]|nr:HD-GYP domain-containing protein [Nitrospirota bacterium]MBF0535237.1 HD-GYP domain-containing protein [Nitrospirota bacterium]MBF0615283.1 HD-GYP domain-containing protein [Nitrospirota bacterium]
MIKTIETEELKVGMYVKISESWHKHPFIKNEFVITNDIQIKQIIENGIKSVFIDTDKGILTIKNIENITHSDKDLMPPIVWQPDKLMPDDLKEAIEDTTMPKREKAKQVYKSSLQVMGKLFESPTAENIKTSKDAVASLVDMILREPETSGYLLNITSHDFYTYTHSVNVGILSIMVSKEIFKNSDAHNMHEIGAGFFLHDIGKTKITPRIINKPGRLTDDEMFEMRTHPYQGYKILKEADQLSEECKIIVMQHHEREDGTGYPRRLKKDEIHPYGRIGCISDVFDAITAERSYKQAMSPFEALKLMKEEMLHHFQEEIFSKFVLIFSK